jgi:hypothetical protein
MKINKSFYLILILYSLLSCETKLEIKNPVPDKALVLQASMSSVSLPFKLPAVVTAKLVEIQSLDESYYTDTISDAVVILTDEKGFIDTLPFNKESKKYSSNFFYNPNFNYSLMVIKEGYPSLTATDALPLQLQPDSVVIEPFIGYDDFGNPVGEATIIFTDPQGIENYYEVALWSGQSIYSDDYAVTREYYYPLNIQLDDINTTHLLFSDKTFSGQKKSIRFTISSGNIDMDDNGKKYIKGGIIQIFFRNVSLAYYNYQTSLLNYYFNINGDILLGNCEPKNIYTNVKGGYGFFGAYQEYEKTIYHDDIILK